MRAVPFRAAATILVLSVVAAAAWYDSDLGLLVAALAGGIVLLRWLTARLAAVDFFIPVLVAMVGAFTVVWFTSPWTNGTLFGIEQRLPAPAQRALIRARALLIGETSGAVRPERPARERPGLQEAVREARTASRGESGGSNGAARLETRVSLVVSPAGSDRTVTLCATVTAVGGNRVPSGFVFFTDGSLPVGTARLEPGVSSGTGSVRALTIAPGMHAFSARYLGSPTCASSASTPVAYDVPARAP